MSHDSNIPHPVYFQDLLHSVEPDKLRPISNTGSIPITPSCYYCSYCSIRMAASPLQTCRLCQTAVYCTVTCQSMHWKQGHRPVCQEIRRCRKTVTELSTQYREANGIMDVFDRDNDVVFYFASVRGLGSIGKNYLSHRLDLIRAYLRQAQDPYSLQLALEHGLDMLHLDPIQAEGSVRTTIAHCLFSLERYSELYQFVKYWNVVPHKLRAMYAQDDQSILRIEDEDEDDDSYWNQQLQFCMGPSTFLNLQPPQSIFEHQSALVLRPPCPSPLVSQKNTFPPPTQSEVVTVLYVALAKLTIYHTLRGLHLVLSHKLPIETDLIASKIGVFLGLQPAWHEIDSETIRQQVQELLAFANESIPGILTTLLETPTSLTNRQYYDDNPDIPVLQLLKTAWENSPFAFQFLEEYQSRHEPPVAVPRNPKLQQFFHTVYQHYIHQRSCQRERERIRHYWEQVKNTPAVQQLLLLHQDTSRTLDHLLDYPDEEEFSIGRILVALRNQRQVSRVDLVLGCELDDAMELLDREIFLAGEHWMRVRNLPLVQDWLRQHPTVLPVLPEQCNTLYEICELVATIFQQLVADDDRVVPDPSQWKVLFGNAGWVAPLLCREELEEQH